MKYSLFVHFRRGGTPLPPPLCKRLYFEKETNTPPPTPLNLNWEKINNLLTLSYTK